MEDQVADRHTAGAKSKYTADRQMPGSFEGETVTRRRFMNVVTQGSGAVAVLAFTLPALGFALGPLFSREPFDWQTVGTPSDFTELTYATKVITIVQGIGNAGNTIAYMRKRDPAIDTEPADQYNQYVALSSRCMHLGCPVRYVRPLSVSSARATAASTTSAGWSSAVLQCVRSTASTPASTMGWCRSGRAIRSTSSCIGSRRVIPASRSMASASTCIRSASTPPSSRRTNPPLA